MESASSAPGAFGRFGGCFARCQCARRAPKTGRAGQALAKKRQMDAVEEQKFGMPPVPRAVKRSRMAWPGDQKHKGVNPRRTHSLGCGLELHLPLPSPFVSRGPRPPFDLDQIVIVSLHRDSPSQLLALSLLRPSSVATRNVTGLKSGPGLTQR